MSTAVVALVAFSAHAVQSVVSVRTLLPQMTDLVALSKVPAPFFVTRQASSYDRRSVSKSQDWFANGDAGNFLRTEVNEGHEEFVMADLKGPGSVVRIWSANPAGIIRFYFDGETKPRIQENMASLLTGGVAPLSDPIAYESARGANLYFPFPYQKSLKITVQNSNGSNAKTLYYHVGYREYEVGTSVHTFAIAQLLELSGEISTIRELLGTMRRSGPEDMTTEQVDASVAPGKTVVVFEQNGTGAIYSLVGQLSQGIFDGPDVWSHPAKLHNLYRNVVFEIEFDGTPCVAVPFGDFFGSAPGVNPYRTLPMEVRDSGDMVCRFVMPFKSSAKIKLRNVGSVPAFASLSVRTGSYEFDDRSMHFHAQWSAVRSHTRPFVDMSFLKTVGTGTWIGSAMHISNPVPDWWGEGDEKIYIDGEKFPSTFGTGTEDYYGYAWCSPIPFVKPYHSQPRCDGPGNRGHTSINRWHILDAMPYQRSFEFDMEMWHWAEVTATFARTAYWYSKPGGPPPISIDTTLLAPPEIVKPKPVEGALEAENFRILSSSGGETEKQGGFWQLSSDLQLWWKHGKPGDNLVLEFDSPADGRFEILGNFCHAKDYGILKLEVNGADAAQFDFYKAAIEWKVLSLGTHTLKKGKNTLTVRIVGTHQQANPKSHMFGLDYLILSKK